jgi:hypothetical protein|tara:strand:+ start:3322 stop:3804 length:483 start_codon:yes stop_codon:yes gene_type:complete
VKENKIYKCINNFIENDKTRKINHILNLPSFPWYKTSYKNTFTHILFQDGNPISSFVDLLEGFPEQIKENIFFSQLFLISKKDKIEKILEKPFEEKANQFTNLIYYVNSCDGETLIGSVAKFKSVQNRAIFCSSHLSINETNCTDEDFRIILYITYKTHD